jgi:hypothetical protein
MGKGPSFLPPANPICAAEAELPGNFKLRHFGLFTHKPKRVWYWLGHGE